MDGWIQPALKDENGLVDLRKDRKDNLLQVQQLEGTFERVDSITLPGIIIAGTGFGY
jgi:hypothetical protein